MDERWDIKCGTDEVLLRSACRLNFQPTDWRRDMRDKLAAAIRSMREVRPGERLFAEFASSDLTMCDVENILLYNVGLGAFSTVSRNGFLLARRFNSSECESAAHFKYSQRYRIGDGEPSGWARQTSRQFAAFDFTLPASGVSKPEVIWHACRSGRNIATATLPTGALLQLTVQLELPASDALRPINIAKPLLDGIVAAFHCHNGGNLGIVLPRLAARLPKISPETLQSLLLDESMAVLGKRNLLWPFGNGIQWNPADDLLTDIDLRVERGSNSRMCRGALSECVPV